MYPLIVHFDGKMGLDHGGLRMEFLTLVTQMTEMILSDSHTNAGLPIEDFHKLLFAAGVFIGTNRQRSAHLICNIFFFTLGLGIVQCGITPAFTLTLH